MTSYRNQRPGVTLTEVLVALFVMAIGMIALLTLFPLGMMQINQSIKDDRSTQAADNADYLMRTHWRQYVIEAIQRRGARETDLVDPFYDPNRASLVPPLPVENFYRIDYMVAMENPNFVTNTTVAMPFPKRLSGAENPRDDVLMPPLVNIIPPATAPAYSTINTRSEEISRPSYPVFVDPYGDVARQTGALAFSRRWVAGIHPDANSLPMIIPNTFTRIPRRSLNFPGAIIGPNWEYRHATLTDDMEFGQDGASNSDGNGVSRSGRFNWSYVLQRSSQGNRLNMNMSIIVYDRRAYKFARTDEEVAYQTNVVFYPGASTVTFQYNPASGLPAPAIRSGQWIMDGTITPDTVTVPPTNPAVTPARPIRNANFYRVTSVTDDPATGTITFDLQTPIKALPGATLAAGQGYIGQLYVLNGVAEVFERRPLTLSDTPVVP